MKPARRINVIAHLYQWNFHEIDITDLISYFGLSAADGRDTEFEIPFGGGEHVNNQDKDGVVRGGLYSTVCQKWSLP